MSIVRQSSDENAAPRDDAVLAEINVTPFTDVLLVLLIIFMILASLAIPPGFEREMSGGCVHRVPTVEPRRVTVTVTRAGAIFVSGTPTSVSALYPFLARLHSRSPRDTVSLYADAKAPYGMVIRVIDAAKAANIADVAFDVQ